MHARRRYGGHGATWRNQAKLGDEVLVRIVVGRVDRGSLAPYTDRDCSVARAYME